MKHIVEQFKCAIRVRVQGSRWKWQKVRRFKTGEEVESEIRGSQLILKELRSHC